MKNAPRPGIAYRCMTPDDYPRFVELHNHIYPTRTRTVEEVVKADQNRDPGLASGRWAAFTQHRLVGYAGFAQWTGEAYQGWFQIQVAVDASLRRRGIGSQLYAHALDDMMRYKPRTLRADAYENLPDGLPFAVSLGFKDVFREGPSHLDLTHFSASRFAPLLDQLEAQGIRLLSYAAYKRQNPSFADPLYVAYREAWRDVPKEKETDLPRADWDQSVLESAWVDDDISTVALRGDWIVGFCEVGPADEGRPVYAGLAGVNREERGKGIATATYVRSIQAARLKGHPQMQTSSAVQNVPMQTVYAKLGFVREPVWIQLEKRLR